MTRYLSCPDFEPDGGGGGRGCRQRDGAMRWWVRWVRWVRRCRVVSCWDATAALGTGMAGEGRDRAVAGELGVLDPWWQSKRA